MIDPYERLGNAVIIQAAKDYRRALKKLKRNPENGEAKQTKSEIERFFCSDWFRELTSADGEMIMKKIREEFKI